MNAHISHATGTAGAAEPEHSAPEVAEVTFSRALRAEWLKLLALRLNWWLCAAAVALLIVTLIATVLSTRFLMADASLTGGDARQTGLNLFENAFSIFTLVTLLMGALAAVAITTEHTSGSIRSSLAAVPNRTVFFFAKLLAVLGFIGALTAVLVVLSFAVLLPLSGFYDVLPELLGPEIWWLVFSSWAVVVITSAIGFGLGALLRSTAGAVVTYCLLLFSGPIALGLLLAVSGGAGWVTELMRFEIFALQRQFIAGTASMSTDLPVPLAGLLLLVWAGAAVVPGWLVFSRRDA